MKYENTGEYNPDQAARQAVADVKAAASVRWDEIRPKKKQRTPSDPKEPPPKAHSPVVVDLD